MKRQQANVTINALIQPLSETQASAISGGSTTRPPEGFVRISPVGSQPVNIYDPSNPNHC